MTRALPTTLLLAVASLFALAPASAEAAPSKKKVKATAKRCKEDPEACAKEAAAAAAGAAGAKGAKGAKPAPPPAPSTSSSSSSSSGGNLVDSAKPRSSSGGGKLNNSSGGGGKLNNSSGSSSNNNSGGRLTNSSSSSSSSSKPPPPKGGSGGKKKKSHKGGGKKTHKGSGHTVHRRDGRRGRIGITAAPRVSITEQADAPAVISYGAELDGFYRVKGKFGPLAAVNFETNGLDATGGVLLGARGLFMHKQKVSPLADIGLAIQGVPGFESARVGPQLRAGIDYAIKKNTSLSFLVGGALYLNQPEKEPSSAGALHVAIALTGWP